jgi:DNA-binding NarL/FixJ family response regulator
MSLFKVNLPASLADPDRMSLFKVNRREEQIIRGMIAGLGYKQIAHETGLTEASVKQYTFQLRRRTKSATNEQLVAWWFTGGCPDITAAPANAPSASYDAISRDSGG